MRSIVVFVQGAGLLILLCGCGPRADGPERELVWPAPPENPRIKFLRSFAGESDVGERSRMLEGVGGKGPSVNLIKPYGICVDKEGRIYVSDTIRGKVLMWDFQRGEFKVIGNEPGPATLLKALNVAVSEKGNLYVSDGKGLRVNVYDRDANFLFAVGGSERFTRPTGLAVDDDRDRLYVVDTPAHDIKVFSLTGKFIETIGKRGTGDAEFNFPTNVCVDSAGKVYVADTFNFRIQILTPGGKLIRKFGAQGTRFGQFDKLKGIAVDSEGHIYAADASFCNVQIFDQMGRLLLFFGTGGRKPGQFQGPAGVFVDDRDRIYVVDPINRRVQVFQYLGKKYEEEKRAGTKGKAQGSDSTLPKE